MMLQTLTHGRWLYQGTWWRKRTLSETCQDLVLRRQACSDSQSPRTGSDHFEQAQGLEEQRGREEWQEEEGSQHLPGPVE